MANNPTFDPQAGESWIVRFKYAQPKTGQKNDRKWILYGVEARGLDDQSWVEYGWFTPEKLHNLLVEAGVGRESQIELGMKRKRSGNGGRAYDIYMFNFKGHTYSTEDGNGSKPAESQKESAAKGETLDDLEIMMLHCFSRARNIINVHAEVSDLLPTFEDLQKVAVSLFIEARRNGVVVETPEPIKEKPEPTEPEMPDDGPPPPGDEDALPF